jgi:hypothetical protein
MMRKGREALPGTSDSLSDAGQVCEETAGRTGKGYEFDDVTGNIIGVCIELHETPGPGFREIRYQPPLRLVLEAGVGLLPGAEHPHLLQGQEDRHQVRGDGAADQYGPRSDP